MSSSSTSPQIRPVEQFQAVELGHDEPSQRSLGLKQIDKELVERLSVRFKEEEHDGSKNGKQKELAPSSIATDECEEFEHPRDLPEVHERDLCNVSDIQETTSIILGGNLPDASGLSSKGTIRLHEQHEPSFGCAVNGNIERNKDREECLIAGSMKTGNDVGLVKNADQNGNIESSAVNVAGIECSQTNAQDSSKETCSIAGDTMHSKTLEKVPDNLIPDVRTENIVDVSHQLSISKETSTTAASPISEKFERHVEEVNTAAKVNGVLVNQQCKAEFLLEPAVQNATLSCSDALMTETVDAVYREMVPVEIESPSGVEVHTMTKSEMPSVGSEDFGKHEVLEMANVAKPEMKIESVERTIESSSKTGHEPKTVEQDIYHQKSLLNATQMKIDFDSSHNDNTYVENSRSEVSNVAEKSTTDILNSNLSGDGLQARGHVKRDIEFKQQEPAKRMRRWGSGNQLAVDPLEPLTSGTVKKMKLPIHDSTFVSQGVSPRVVATSRSLPPKMKADSEPNCNTRRIVPPSANAPSKSLKVERFIRPFTLKAVKDMLAEFGEYTDFWMDQIKTHCFVSYSSVEAAVAARNGLYGRQWPPHVGNFLTADYVDSSEVTSRLKGLPEKPPAAPPEPPPRTLHADQAPRTLHVDQAPFIVSHPPLFKSDSTISQMPSFSRRDQYSPAPREPAPPTLDDLFFKTKSRPHIYYLPLTKEQVAEKLRTRQAFG